ncbi:MAG: error-prone DNA polymerase [Pirellulaceae bacterium]
MKYAELHCKTNFSFLEGASHASELVERAVELGYAALAVTDRNTLAGVVRAHAAAKEQSLRLIIGAELTPIDAPPIVLWAPDRAAYGRLARLITLGRRRAVKGDCVLTFDDLAQHSQGLLAGLVTTASCTSPPDRMRAPHSGPPYDHHTTAVQEAGAASEGIPARSAFEPPTRDLLRQFREVFAERGYLLAALRRGPDDRRQLDELRAQSKSSGIPLVASGNVLYHVPGRWPLHDVLTAVRHGTTVAEAGDRRQPNAERHLHTLEELQTTFARVPAAVHRTLEIAARCTFSLDELRYEYPEELAPRGQTPFDYLQQLTWQGAHKRYPDGIPDKVRRLLDHELMLVKELHYEAYFLTVWDLVRFARHRHILCQGRGSAANSAICFSLGVTSVDPDRMDVLFERFVSRERQEAPDIDVDFEHERREEVLQYLYGKYGRERAGMTGVVITYRTRSAIRDVGKALGLSLDCVDALAKQVDGHAEDSQLAERCRQVGLDPDSQTGRRLLYLVNELIGFPRHLSQHVGGMVITQGPLCELVPIENAAMPDRTVIQWDKDDLDTLGLLKVDCLALGMLTAIHRCLDMIRQHARRSLTLASIPAGDDRVYDMICRADTMGVFQIESRAQMSMLPRLKPRCFYDLVIEVAIVRPGPIQGNMVHPYLRRRAGEEAVSYPNDAIRDVLHKTLGVPIFQEQAMRLAVVAAGFTPGEADQLRRAMGAWRRPGVIDRFRNKLLEGMRAQGLTAEFADQVFRQIRGFGEYGFPESHAASFALLVYVSAWLKHYYPAAFAAALLNSQPMGFYAPSQLIRDAQQHGVTVLPVDVNASDWDCTLERLCDAPLPADSSPPSTAPTAAPPLALRLGFRLLTGLPRTTAESIVHARHQQGLFQSLADFSRRTQLGRALQVRLAEADVFASLSRDRRNALWEALSQTRTAEHLPLWDALPPEEELPVVLPKLTPQEEVFADYRTAGLSLKAHPLSFHRLLLNQLNVVPAEKLRSLQNRRRVCVAGLVLLRQRPGTAKGITFVTLEDETGTSNLLVHPSTWERYYQVARRSAAWLAHGRLETKDSVVHVIVERLEDLSGVLGRLQISSRDFR